MPRLPQASDLNNVSPQAARSFVNMPVPDIAGATGAIARGVADVGGAIATVDADRRKKAAAQERFDTKMGLLKAEEAYAERARELDPLDPDYVEKKKALYREAYAPVLSGVKDPENKQMFDLSSYEGFVNIGTTAATEHKAARQGKTKLDLSTYSEEQRRRIAAGEDPEKVRAAVQQMIADADLDELTKLELGKQLLDPIDMDAAETKAFNLQTGGGGATDKAAAILRQFEGFKATPYWDENADRVGYGSDTVTLEDGTVVKVTKGMKITKADAERDLQRRVREFEAGAARASGEAWNNLSPEQQAALTSVAYNYGSLPKRVVTAIQTGDANKIADAVESLSDHNAGINRKRRMAEAALIRGASVPSSWTERPTRDTVLAELERDPSYLRLGVDQRDKVKASVISRYEKIEKEEQAAARIQLQRDTVERAVAEFDDPAKAEAYIKQSITDPDTREDALTLYRKEQDQIAENRRRAVDDAVNNAWAGATTALDEGDVAEAQRIARTAEIPAKDRDALLERIDKGRAIVDDPEVYNELQALKLGTPEDRERFTNLDLVKLQGKLKPATIDKLAKEQEDLKKAMSETGKPIALDTASQMIDLRLREVGVDTTAKAKPADLRMSREIKALASRNLDAATAAKGRALTPIEIEEVMDQTFMEFRTIDKGLIWDSEKTMTISDVLGEFGALEEKHGATQGEYIERAERALRAKGVPVTPAALRKWLEAGVNKGVLKKKGEAQ
jgi:GH24 family phage-related lysozyme (muramidase)